MAGARVRAFVDEKGKVQDCEVISFAGNQRSADALCNAYTGKKVKPAVDVNGSPIGGFMETIIWLTPNRNPQVPVLADRPPDVQLTVQQLPGDVTSPFRLTIGLIIDERGAIAACGPIKAEHEALATAACQSIGSETFVVVKGKNDEAIRYARSYDVEFSIAAGSAAGA